MRIDIAPVDNLLAAQPINISQAFDTITAAEDHHAVRHIRKSQAIDFIFGNEHPLDSTLHLCKLRHWYAQIGHAAYIVAAIEHAKTYQHRLGQQTITCFKLTGADGIGVDRLNGQELIE